MEDSRWLRFLPLAGIAAVALWIVGFLTIESVRPEVTTPDQILAYYQEHGDTVGLAIFAWMIGSLLFLVFVGALWNRLQAADEGRSGLAPVAFAAGIAASIGLLALYGSDLEATLDSDVITASTAEAYYYFGDIWWLGAEMMAAVMIAATGILALRTAVLPRWLGWVSLIAAVWLLVPPIGWIAMFLVFPAWVVIVSVLLTPRFAKAPAMSSAAVEAPRMSGSV
jgi:hypothetical protein